MAGMPKSPLSEEDYLHLERSAESKSEFHDGQMFAMAGGSFNHSLLASSVGAILRTQLAVECRVCNSDLRINIASSRTYTYPDCSVICGQPQFSSDQQDCLLNPLLIVEVLSPSTEGYDRGRKFEMYRTITSFREYLIVHQDKAHVEHYSRQSDGSWLLREYSEIGGSVPIGSLNVTISLSDLYASVLEP